MTKLERAKLRSALKGLLNEMLQAGGRTTTTAVYEEAVERFPDLIHLEAERLARSAIITVVRGLLKETMKQEDQPEIRVGLFSDLQDNLTVPKCVAMPSPDGSREMVWVPTLKATLAELKAYVAYLKAGAAADMEKADRVVEFKDFVEDMIHDADPDVPIEDLLRQAQAKAV